MRSLSKILLVVLLVLIAGCLPEWDANDSIEGGNFAEASEAFDELADQAEDVREWETTVPISKALERVESRK